SCCIINLYMIYYTIASSTYVFFFTAPAPPEIYTLSLHDALPILAPSAGSFPATRRPKIATHTARKTVSVMAMTRRRMLRARCIRSEEHTSELQSRENLVCRLLLEKKKKKKNK